MELAAKLTDKAMGAEASGANRERRLPYLLLPILSQASGGSGIPVGARQPRRTGEDARPPWFFSDTSEAYGFVSNDARDDSHCPRSFLIAVTSSSSRPEGPLLFLPATDTCSPAVTEAPVS